MNILNANFLKEAIRFIARWLTSLRTIIMSLSPQARPSPPPADDESSSDSEIDARSVIQLSQIKTIGQLYKEGVLKAVGADKVKKAADKGLLERVSLLCVASFLNP